MTATPVPRRATPKRPAGRADGRRRPAPSPGSIPGLSALVLASVFLLAPFLLAACDVEPADTELDETTYVEVMARLVLLDTALVSARDRPELDVPPDTARRRVLEEWGVEPDDLASFAEVHGDDPRKMEEIWTRIRITVDSLRAAGWRPSGEGDR